MKTIETLEEVIKASEKEIKKQAVLDDNAKLLMTIPGISYFSGLLLSMEIGDINRFANYRKLCCYSGVVSSTHQSADKQYHGHIIKDSNKYIRWCLIEAVNKAKNKDPRLKWFYDKIMRKKGKPKARIATARKLLISIYFMLRNKKVYISEGYKQKVLLGHRLG